MSWGDDQPRIVANGRRELISYLIPLLAGEAEVGSWYPTDANPEAPRLPYLAVANDGAPTSTPTSMRFTVRLTGWADNPGPAFDLVNAARAYALAHPGSTKVDSITRGIGISEATDDRTGHATASCTVIVAARIA